MKSEVSVAQLCSTLCDPRDYGPPGSSVYGILQALILEWVATADPGIEPKSLALQADSLLSEPLGKPIYICVCKCPFFSALGRYISTAYDYYYYHFKRHHLYYLNMYYLGKSHRPLWIFKPNKL